MHNTELIVFIIYFIFMIAIGLFFFLKNRSGGEKAYFLGNRQVNGLIAALSAGASDMSSWVLMGLPASVFVAGLGKVWIAVGLAIGTVLSWIFVAPRLRSFSIVANDSITLPQYLTNRFLSKSKVLQVICAILFIVVYAIYAASSIKACGTLFNTVIGIDAKVAMYIAAAIIIVYTFLGGFSAVCWTDFFQGLLMLIALMLAPIVGAFVIKNGGGTAATDIVENFWNPLPSGRLDWKSISSIITGLGWGLGYFGMPHIIIRFMAIKSPAALRRSRVIGSIWTCLILAFSVAVALVGKKLVGDLDDSSVVFITMVRKLFPAVVSGILLSAILAASMSTADSQLLASASAFASDVYRPIIHKNASNKEMMWVGRIIVILVSIAALLIAANPNSGTIMSLVENAWGLFGAAFGPVILLSLYWKRFTFVGAVASILVGAIVDALWLIFLAGSTGVYEIVPGFICGLLAGYIFSKCTKVSPEALELYDKGVAYDE
ncbi:MAG: sodium/proline symporter [Oscillospiraceae bacterium]|nr:sodium/proline symporter [Oscillospiraceae bacterium]